LSQADLTLVNLKCALTSSITEWPAKEPKPFNFGAALEASQSIIWAGIDGVSLANNLTFDYGVEGLLETTDLLKKSRIEFSGAGFKLKEARKLEIFKRHGMRFGVASYCDHQEDFTSAG
jgi:poly-gamma-glutamate capsule biosynthesis protein CapA/YwtB (metallophosphatase superfamily)